MIPLFEKSELIMSYTRVTIIFLLLAWFFYTFSAFISTYTVSISSDFLRVANSYHNLPKGLFAMFSIIVANMDQYLAFFICGLFIYALIPELKKARTFALLLFSLFTAISLAVVIGNYNSIYGNKIIFLMAKLIVVMLNFLFISLGFVIIQRINKVRRTIGRA